MKKKLKKTYTKKMTQNRPTQSISLGQNTLEKFGTKATHHTNQDTTLLILFLRTIARLGV